MAQPSRRRCRGFTLTELVVVIGIVVLLIALLLPSLSRAWLSAAKIKAASNMRQVASAMITYATDHGGYLPTGVRDDGVEHCIWIGTATRAELLTYLGVDLKLQNQPHQPLLQSPQWEGKFDFFRQTGAGPTGWVIGYNYLAGHPSVCSSPPGATGWQAPWRTVLKMSDSVAGHQPLLADLNEWSTDGWSLYAWPKSTDAIFFGAYQAPDAGQATGGFVAFQDGSVQWRSIGPPVANADGTVQWGEMNQYGSCQWVGTYPCVW